jgi:hypothetical protein
MLNQIYPYHIVHVWITGIFLRCFSESYDKKKDYKDLLQLRGIFTGDLGNIKVDFFRRIIYDEIYLLLLCHSLSLAILFAFKVWRHI